MASIRAAYLRNGYSEEASVVLQTAGTFDPKNAILHYYKGIVLLSQAVTAPDRYDAIESTKLRFVAYRAELSDQQWTAIMSQLDSAFEQEIERLKQQFKVRSREELKSELIRHGTTLTLVQKSYEQRILGEQYLRHKTKNGEKGLQAEAEFFANSIHALSTTKASPLLRNAALRPTCWARPDTT